MQLKTVGESFDVIKSLKQVDNKSSFLGEGFFDNSVKGVKYAEELEKYSLGAIKLAVAQSDLNEEQIKAILAKKGLKGAALDTAAAELYEASQANALAAAQDGASKSSLGLKNALKGLAKNPMTWVAAVTAALYVGIRVWTNYQKKLEKATQKFNDAQSAVSDAKSDLSSLESQLDSNNSKLEEYNDLLSEGQSLSPVQQQELDDLQSENKLLEAQIELQKQLVDIKSNTAAQEAINAANTEKTLYEDNVEKYGKVLGFLQTIGSYAAPDPYSMDYTDPRTEAQKYADKDTTVTGRFEEEYQNYQKIQDGITETEQAILRLKGTGKEIDDETNKNYEQLARDLKSQKQELVDSGSALSVIGEELRGYIEAVKGTDLEAENKSLIDSWEKDLRKIKEIGKTGAELANTRLDNFFSSASGQVMKSYFDSIIENGGTARNVLAEFSKTGAKLSDIGVNAGEFMGYFSSISDAADDATKSLAEYEGTFSSVKNAFESDNSGKNWEDMAGYIKSAKDLYDKGLVGTDDFQSVAQFIAPNDIDTSGYEYAADAYVEAFEKAYKTVKKWYDADNPLDSMWAFMDSLSAAEKKTGIDLISNDYKTADDIKLNFETTAEAAKALGVNVSVVENMLDRLKDYGFELDGIEYSGELLSEYETTLGSIKTLYKELEDEDSKTRLGKLIDGWEAEYGKYQDDLSQLTDDQVVKIKFEYDLASIQKEIDDLQVLVDNGGGTEEYAALLAKKYQKNKMLSDQTGDGFNSTSYDTTGKFIAEYQSKMQGASEEQKQLYQSIISNLMDTQSNILQSYLDLQEYGKGGNVDLANRPTIPTSKLKEKGYENAGDGIATVFTHTFSNEEGNVAINFTPILPDGSVMDKDSFDKYCQEVVDGVHGDDKNLQIGATFEGEDAVNQAEDAANKIHELQQDFYLDGGVQNIELGVTVNDSDAQREVNSLADQLSNGSSITYKAHLDDGSLAEITMWKEEDGTITYTAKLADGTEKEIEGYAEKDGVITYTSVDNTNVPTNKTQTVTTNYSKGSSPTTVDDASGVANFTLGDFPKTVPDATGVANFKLGDYPKSSDLPTLTQKIVAQKIGFSNVSGTAITSHATGTAYSAWTSYRHSMNAYANGTRNNWELPTDEYALTNEIGQESIVRNGIWQTIPGGAHIEQLKKGDIIFNAKQTEELLKYGKVSSNGGHGIVAHADGTAYNTLPAYAGGRLKKKSSSSSSKKSTKTSSKKSSGKSSSSDSTKVSDAIQKIADWVGQFFDWIEVKINYLESKAESYYAKAENAISRGLIYSGNYATAYNNISKAIQTNTSLITANQQGSTRYMKQADKIQSKYNSKLSSGDKKTFNNAVNTLKAGGTIDISEYNANVRQALDDYQTWYEKAQDCANAVDQLNSTLIEQKQALYNLPLDLASEKVERLEKDLASLDLAYSKLLTGKAASTSTQNSYLDQQLANQKAQVDALNAAMNSAQNTVNALSKTNGANNNAISAANANVISKQNALNTAKANVKSKGNALLNNSKIKKTLTAAQRTAISNGQQITLTSSQKKKLSSSQISSINAYNNAVKAVTSATTALSNANNALANAQNNASSSAMDLELARQALQQATKDAAEAEKEYIEQMVENEQQKFENVKEWYQQIIDYEQALKDLEGSSGAYDSAKDYNVLIENTRKQISAMESQLKSAVNSKIIQEGSAEWYDMKGQIIEVQQTLEELQQTQRKVELEEMFERAMTQADNFISRLETIRDLIQDEMMFDDNGKLTQNGMLALSIDNRNFETAKKNLATSIKEIQKIKDDYAKKYGTDFTAGISTEFDELMDDAESKMLSYLKDVQSYQQSMLDIVLNSVETEKDALKDLINARKEALQKKKEYYDYDKNLKDKNKEINLIKQQVAALQGSTSKTDIAKMQQLQAQLKEAEDDRNDTVREHLYDMQSEAFDELSNTLDEDFEKYTNQLKSSYEESSKAIIAFLNNNGGVLSTSDFERITTQLVSQFMTADQVTVGGITKGYASGTRRASHRHLAITNEKGQEMIYRASDGSILTMIDQNDTVFSAEKVRALYDMLEQNPIELQHPFAVVPQSNIVSNNVGGDTFTIDNSITVQGDLVRDTLPDLQTIIKKSSEYTQNEIRKDLRKAGRK